MYHPELFPELAQKNAKVKPVPIKQKTINHAKPKKQEFSVVDFLVETQEEVTKKKKRQKSSTNVESKNEKEHENRDPNVIDITEVVEIEDSQEPEMRTVIKPYVFSEGFAKTIIGFSKRKSRIKQKSASNLRVFKENIDRCLPELDRILFPNTEFYKDLNEIHQIARPDEKLREDEYEDLPGTDDEFGEALAKQDTMYSKIQKEREISFEETLNILMHTKSLRLNEKAKEFVENINADREKKENQQVAKMQDLINSKASVTQIYEAFKEDYGINEETLKKIREEEEIHDEMVQKIQGVPTNENSEENGEGEIEADKTKINR
jgi:hypothetical protein